MDDFTQDHLSAAFAKHRQRISVFARKVVSVRQVVRVGKVSRHGKIWYNMCHEQP